MQPDPQSPAERALLLSLAPQKIQRHLWTDFVRSAGEWPEHSTTWLAFEQWSQTAEAWGHWCIEQEALACLSASILTPLCPHWPISLPPEGVLRVKGVTPRGRAVGIIGARRADRYGRDLARRVAEVACAQGWSVISGGAAGADAAAHEGALSVGGRTVWLMGGGLGQRLSADRQKLAERVAEQGAVVSPFPCQMPPKSWVFPERNRWLAHWVEQLVVVQADRRSGSMITARAALQAHRPVWSAPGPLDSPLHQGCHALLEEGARCLSAVDAWLPESEGVSAVEQPADLCPSDPVSAAIWAAASVEPEGVAALARRAGLTVAQAGAAVILMEMEGWLSSHPGGRYARGHLAQEQPR